MSIKTFFRDEWSAVAGAWERWGPALRRQSAAATDWLLALADVRPGAVVLDLASGTGDPALELARRVGPAGRVVATDLVEGALQMTARGAAAAGLTNVVTRVSDMEALPFADASFDVVTCRLGLMFCSQPGSALAEARRVLRPGGRAAFVVWGSPGQPLFEATLGQVRRALATGVASHDERSKRGRPAEHDGPAAPGPFRFANPAELSPLLAAAGFSDVFAEQRVLPWPFAGSGAEQWRMFVELGGPSFRGQLDQLAAPARRALDERVAAALDAHASDGNVSDQRAWLVGAVGLQGSPAGQLP